MKLPKVTLFALLGLVLAPHSVCSQSEKDYTLTFTQMEPGKMRVDFELLRYGEEVLRQDTLFGIADKTLFWEPGRVSAFKVRGALMYQEATQPRLPYVSFSLQTAASNCNITALDAEWQYDTLSRVRPDESDLTFNRKKNLVTVTTSCFASLDEDSHFPGSWMQPLSAGDLRDVTIVPFRLNFFRSYENRNQIVILRKGSFIITYTEPKPITTTSKNFAELYKDLVINYTESNNRDNPVAPLPEMLVITTDSFYNNMLPYVEWKNQKGIRTEMVKLFNINMWPTPQLVKDYIKTYYSNHPGLEYVLLVGDHHQVPMWFGVGNSAHDHGYSTIVGNDYMPDLIVSRFSAGNKAECDLYVNKSLNYERTPNLAKGFFDKAMVISSNDFQDNSHGLHMRSYLLNHGFSYVDDYRELTTTNTTTNVTNSLNDGRSWLFFIGHGYSTGWGNVHPSFDNSNINGLTNNEMLPAIVSVACANSDLDYTGDDCFGERWLDVAQDRGSIVFLGATENCAFFWTDTLGKHAVFSYGDRTSETFGAAMNYGKMAMFNSFPQGQGGLTEETMQQFLMVGDPTIMPWTHLPQNVQVSYPAAIGWGNQDVEVFVEQGGYPVADAWVALTNDDYSIYATGRTGGDGRVILSVNPAVDDTLRLVVSGFNIIPQEEQMTVNQSVGTEQLIVSNSVAFYPNPMSTSGVLTWSKMLEMSLGQITDVAGQVVRNLSAEGNSIVLERDNLSPGMYFYRLHFTNGQNAEGTFVIQ